MTIEEIKADFSKYKISEMQLDPFGVCNAKCWFCPVKYKGNPASGKETMSPELMEKIFIDLIEERGKENGLVSKSFNGFYTAHYNEILLYKHFDKMLELCRKYKLCTLVLSNGTTLTPEKIDLIKSYPDVVNGLCLNIPAFEAETWSKRSGMNINVFPKLINNIKYAYENLTQMVESKNFSIQINGVNQNSLKSAGGWINKGESFPIDIDLDPLNGELETQFKIATNIFPKMNIYKYPHLIDRAGLLGNVISIEEEIGHLIGVDSPTPRGSTPMISNFDCKALDNPVIAVCLSAILSHGVNLFDNIFNISFPLICNELTAFIFKAFKVPAFPPIVPIPTLPLNKVVIAVEVATPVENK
jgi:hypothetical protein